MSVSGTVATPAQSARHANADRLAGRLAALGAGLGVIAGLVDVAIGPSIRGWIGNKLNPTPLGLLTVVLSALALVSAIRWMRPGGRDGGRRLATILAFLLPAGICFTTIGRLWYPPGVLLLGAAILVVGTTTRSQLSQAVNAHHWLSGLTWLLGAYYLLLGGDTLPKAAGVLGILGALAIWAALLAKHGSHRRQLLLLIVGAVPFALATWWSVVTPLIALLVLTVGPAAMRSERAGPGAIRGRTRTSAPAPTGLGDSR